MVNSDVVREAISRHFEHVQDLGDGILRGERRHNNKPYAVAFIDLSDSVVERSHELAQFQEKLLGADFFNAENDLRWNSYLYFLAGPKSMSDAQFVAAKAQIEADRHFARKFVLSAEELAIRLGERRQAETRDPTKTEDVAATWSKLLRSASLGVLLEQRPRTTVLEQLASGEAFQAEGVHKLPSAAPKLDALATGFVRKLTIGEFRRVNRGQQYGFGDVNLIVGLNGTGKTSLLEAIELLYCGRVRRDPAASFEDIVAEVETPQGKVEQIAATTTPSILKARNLSWYRRPDPLSAAISQGFTRFNFLDTDAAFRLSSEPTSEQIKIDLGRLIVGPETSKLWTYLSKLAEEVAGNLRALDERLPSQRRHVELLADEVKRYADAPSEANSLVRAFRASVFDMHFKLPPVSGAAPLGHHERAQLESVARAISQVLVSIPGTPVTIAHIRQRVTQLRDVLETVKRLQRDHESMLKELTVGSSRVAAAHRGLNDIEQWAKLIDAGVPALAQSLQALESRVSYLRGSLSGQSADLPPEVVAEYANLPIEEALGFARTKAEEARRMESAASLALLQGQKLGQTLAMLRRDLHDASVAFIEQSGESSKCPVCGTTHGPGDLIAKVEALVAANGATQAESLRRNLQLAKERFEREQVAVELLTALDGFRRSNALNEGATAITLRNQLIQNREELRSTTAKMQALRSSAESLRLAGIDWMTLEQVRSAAVPALPAGVEPTDVEAVKAALGTMRLAVLAETSAQAALREQSEAVVAKMNETAASRLSQLYTGLAPPQIVTFLERALHQAEGALSAAEEVAKVVPLDSESPLEELQQKAEASVLAYERALDAIKREERATGDLKKKTEELRVATETLVSNTSARDYYAKANEVLSALVVNHSLDSAAAEAFATIKDKVSEVFARIHSPPEYELGEFSDGELIVRRDDSRPHYVNQVSAGQRAALALSIFLALNDSAKTVPPVILIDDPVAHVDDLNALSFLDYVRDVVISSRRQVFFSTADIRLAALFERKFEFLGNRFRRISLSR